MALVPKFNMKHIEAHLKKAETHYTNQIVRVLRIVGEKAVNEAKANGNYQDRTANLRNSIGYVIAINGNIIDENFNASANGTEPNKEDPIKYGKNLAYEVVKNYGDIVLIVVSGMKYGAFVESKGYNVLTSAEQLANIEVPRLLKEIKK